MATDRYATNQFYKLDAFEPFKDASVSTLEDNPPFIYPPKTLRNPANGTSTPIQRGYLRMMAELIDKDKFGQLARRRLHFQFNPDSIVRSVSARNDIQLWMNMDPSQITQPIPGDMNFAFELLFNREAEVTSGKYMSPGMYAAAGTTNLTTSVLPANLPIESGTGASQYSVTDIGVLADLIVFDELIGQGLNAQLLEAMVDRAATGAAYTDAQKAKAAKDTTKDDEDQTPVAQESTFSRNAVQDALNANWGNSAFLISQPIRVVFSSLFIVEGYVTSTTVTFNKFTPTMVPVQAVVGIQMQAMYVGFGKKETFFTKTFAANEKNYQDVVNKVSAEHNALSALGRNLYSKIGGEEDGDAKRRIGPSGVIDTSGNGEGGGDAAWVRFKASDELRDEISERKSIEKITVSANLTIVYLGNKTAPMDPYTQPVGVTVPLNDEVYNETVSYDLSPDELNNKTREPYSTAEWSFPQLRGEAGRIFDKTSNSYYQLKLLITTTILGVNGSSVECQQTVKKDVTLSWNDTTSLQQNATLHVDDPGSIAAAKARWGRDFF